MKDGTFDGKFSGNGAYSVTIGKTNYTVVTEDYTIDCAYNDTTNCSKCEAHFPVELEQLTCDKTKFKVVVRDKLTQELIEGATVVITQGKEYVPKGVELYHFP